jgi:peptide deformylase
MSVRIIVKHPDPILRQKCNPVQKFNGNLHKLLDDMAETMYMAAGVGLAAPQVGILKRAVVVDGGSGLLELINPEIIDHKGVQVGREGCLSIPALLGDVRRAKWIKVKAQNRYGEEFTMEASDFLARVIQHEIDHLNGILFIDLAIRIYSSRDSK